MDILVLFYRSYFVESPSLNVKSDCLTNWLSVPVVCLSCRHLIDACSLRIQTNCLIGAYSWQAPRAQSKTCRLHKCREVDKCLGRTLILFSHIVQHAQVWTHWTRRWTLALVYSWRIYDRHICLYLFVSACVSAAPPAHCHSLRIPNWKPRRVKIFV